jgi:hypothetical protein
MSTPAAKLTAARADPSAPMSPETLSIILSELALAMHDCIAEDRVKEVVQKYQSQIAVLLPPADKQRFAVKEGPEMLCPVSHRGLVASTPISQGHVVLLRTPEKFIQVYPTKANPRSNKKAASIPSISKAARVLKPDQVVSWSAKKIGANKSTRSDDSDEADDDTVTRCCESLTVYLFHRISTLGSLAATVKDATLRYPLWYEHAKKDVAIKKQRLLETTTTSEEFSATWEMPFKIFFEHFQHGTLLRPNVVPHIASVVQNKTNLDTLWGLIMLFDKVVCSARVPVETYPYHSPVIYEDDVIGRVNHSCNANMTSMIFGNQVLLVALQDIKEGEELTLNYLENPNSVVPFPDIYHVLGRNERAGILQLHGSIDKCACPLCLYQNDLALGRTDSGSALLSCHSPSDIQQHVKPTFDADLHMFELFIVNNSSLFTKISSKDKEGKQNPETGPRLVFDRSTEHQPKWVEVLNKSKVLVAENVNVPYSSLAAFFTCFYQMADVLRSSDIVSQSMGNLQRLLDTVSAFHTQNARFIGNCRAKIKDGSFSVSEAKIFYEAFSKALIHLQTQITSVVSVAQYAFVSSWAKTAEDLGAVDAVANQENRNRLLWFWKLSDRAAQLWIQNTPWVVKTPLSDIYKIYQLVYSPTLFESLGSYNKLGAVLHDEINGAQPLDQTIGRPLSNP